METCGSTDRGRGEVTDRLVTARSKNLGNPDETVRFPGIVQNTIELGDLTVAHTVLEAGWRWSKDVQPTVGGSRCQARHVGTVLSGAFAVEFPDGSRAELHAGDVYDIPPDHDGYTVGESPCVLIEWAGIRAFSGFRVGGSRRQLVTLLLTDVVDSTPLVRSMGDSPWRDLLSSHYEMARAQLDVNGGREIKTTGDGLLAIFDAPAPAVRCAQSISSRAENLSIRVGVHVGEVEQVGDDVRGLAVHEVARIMGEAGPGQVLVSETTRAFAASFSFDDMGMRTLKGIGEMHLFALSTTVT
jgi:adenylate/guanylate cyclase family protein